jgi:hypothetical protein
LDISDVRTHNEIDHILIEDDIQVYLISLRAAICDTDHYLVVAEVRERLAVSKQTTHRVHIERFNLKKLSRG